MGYQNFEVQGIVSTQGLGDGRMDLLLTENALYFLLKYTAGAWTPPEMRNEQRKEKLAGIPKLLQLDHLG